MPKCDFNKVACNFNKIALQHGCSPVNFLHIFRTTFYNNTHGGLPLNSKRFERPFIWHTSIPALWTQELDAGLWTLDAGLWTLDSGR